MLINVGENMRIKIDEEEWNFNENNMNKNDESDLRYIRGKLDILVKKMVAKDVNAASKKSSPLRKDGQANLNDLFDVD